MPSGRHPEKRRPSRRRPQKKLQRRAKVASLARRSRKARNAKQMKTNHPYPASAPCPRCTNHPADRYAPLRPAWTPVPAAQQPRRQSPARLQSVPRAGERTNDGARGDYKEPPRSFTASLRQFPAPCTGKGAAAPAGRQSRTRGPCLVNDWAKSSVPAQNATKLIATSSRR